MPSIVVKYVKKGPRNGNLIYRRRVPDALKGHFLQTEIVKVLGRTTQDALISYGPLHRQIEHILALAKNGVAGLSPAEQRERLIAALKSWGADPFGPGQTDQERTWRAEVADRMVTPFQNPDTGEYEGVPPEIDVQASALLGGVAPTSPGPTITDAFKFYLSENVKPIAEQRKKQEQRYARSERNLIAVVGSDKLISTLTKEDARKWRDMRVAAGVAPATVIREKNDIAAVIATALSELSDGGNNPFANLKLPKAKASRQDDRDALPLGVIEGMYAALAGEPDLLWIWTLLDFTGARPSEIRQLMVSEIVLSDPIPHIVIQERDDRTLKTSWSTRLVPLVGEALKVAGEVVRRRNDPTSPAFPRYAGAGGMDRLSAALSRRLRVLTKNPKHVAYSLRHNMKDRMRAAEVHDQTQKAIEGHALGAGQAASYGGQLPLPQKRDGLLKALAGYRGMGSEKPD